MPTVEQERDEALTKRVVRYFVPSHAETLVIQSLASGRLRSPAKQEESKAISEWEEWPAARSCRASVLGFLLTDEVCKKNTDPRGLALQHVVVDGLLELERQDIGVPLRLTDCVCRGGIQLRDAKFPSLGLRRVIVVGPLDVHRAHLHSSFMVVNSEIFGTVNLAGILLEFV
jgi:hypothetical protein